MPFLRVATTFTPLAATGLGIDRAGIFAAMEPFVARRLVPSDPAWQAEVERKSAKTKQQLRKRRWLGWLRGPRRDQRRIDHEDPPYRVLVTRGSRKLYRQPAARLQGLA